MNETRDESKPATIPVLDYRSPGLKKRGSGWQALLVLGTMAFFLGMVALAFGVVFVLVISSGSAIGGTVLSVGVISIIVVAAWTLRPRRRG